MSQAQKYYTSKSDLVFKTVMMDMPELLGKIIEVITEEKVNNIEILNSELPIASIEVKSHRLDIIVQSENKIIDLEMNNKMKEYTRFRNYLYLMDKANNMVMRGKSYSKLLDKNFILINLIYGEKPKTKRKDEIIEIYKIQNKKRIYIDNIKIIDVNLDLLKYIWYDLEEKEQEKYKYLYMLDLQKEELKEFSKGDKEMEDYKNKLDKLNKNTEFRDRISAEEDALYCYNSDIELAEEKGISIGKDEAKLEDAKNFLKLGVEVDIISKATGLSKEKILSLKE